MPVITPERMIVEDEAADSPLGRRRTLWISEAGGLTQFGALIEILEPGSRSSLKHWHSAEDEMVYVLDGEVTLIEGDAETLLRPGGAATFRAGDPLGALPGEQERRADALPRAGDAGASRRHRLSRPRPDLLPRPLAARRHLDRRPGRSGVESLWMNRWWNTTNQNVRIKPSIRV